ncbi:MAG: hypothetical protein K2Q12_11285 [Rickettsiales bacterium]|nr:hypothetical protein [Rickettsiales bacterium]
MNPPLSRYEQASIVPYLRGAVGAAAGNAATVTVHNAGQLIEQYRQNRDQFLQSPPSIDASIDGRPGVITPGSDFERGYHSYVTSGGVMAEVARIRGEAAWLRPEQPQGVDGEVGSPSGVRTPRPPSPVLDLN